MTPRRRAVSFGLMSLLGCGDVAGDLITRGGASGTGGSAEVTPTGGTASVAATTGGRAPDDGEPERGGESSNQGPDSGGSGSNEDPGSGEDSGPDTVCESSEDCRGERQLCHPVTHRCVECVEDGHCSDEHETCSDDLGICAVACHSAADCTDDDGVCDLDLDGGICVECRVDGDCGPEGLCRSSECDD
jgi:hypothetical protein